MRPATPFADEGDAGAPALAELDGRLRVLAAEDNPMNQLVLKTVLAQPGVWPVIVEDGAAAVAAWEQSDWDPAGDNDDLAADLRDFPPDA